MNLNELSVGFGTAKRGTGSQFPFKLASILKGLAPLSLFLLLAGEGFAQAASSVAVPDTRSVQEAPSAFNRELRLGFKLRSILGVPGENGFSTNLTIAPWGDYSGGKVHQLNFNDGGVFYRTSDYALTGWEGWRRVFVSNPSGGLDLAGGLSLFGNPDVADNVIHSYQHGRSYSLIGTYPGWDPGAVYIAGYNKYNLSSMATERVRLGQKFTVNLQDGSLGIGTDVTAGYALSVNGKVRAQEVKVYTGWADFVFVPGYLLRPLEEVEAHIKEHGHLPEVPSAEQVQAEGIDLGRTDALLLQKIEELTLYMINQDKKAREQEHRIRHLEERIAKLKKKKI